MTYVIPNQFRTRQDTVRLALLDENFSSVVAQINTITGALGLSGGASTAFATLISSVSSITAQISSLSTQIATVSSSLASFNPVTAGTVTFFTTNTAPTGWVKANGAALSRTTYAALFTSIGTTFGSGDGSTTFNVPDLRGEFIRSWDDGRGADSGRSFGSAQGHALQNITGAFGRIRVRLNQDFTASGAIQGTVGISSGDSNAGGASTIDFTFDASRVVNTAAETRPRNISLLACIKF